jgi:uncharacterized membrane protein YgcG
MSAIWKVLVGLVLTLPVGAYVAGTLVSSQANVPDRRAPVVISGTPTPGAAPSADQSPGDDHGDDHGDEARGLRTVNPTPDQVEDDHGNRGPGGGDDGGDRHGGGDDHGGGSSGSGSGSGSSGSDDHGGHGPG